MRTMNVETSSESFDMKEAEKSAVELEKVYEMLQRLDSKNPEVIEKAQIEVDRYLDERKKFQNLNDVESVAGCKTKSNRTVIAGDNDEEAKKKRREKADQLKNQGNEEFRAGRYHKAAVLYTSSVLEDDSNPLVFTNRAQAYIKLENFDEAIQDCKKAIKLNPNSVKAHVHLAKALRGKGEYQKAIDILEIAEETSKEHFEVISSYKNEVIAAMKEHLLQTMEQKVIQ